MAANYRLKAARTLKGLTQLRLADQVGVKHYHISRLESGRVQPNADLKRRIAEILQKPAFEMFEA